jgi:hypothetical protein
MKAFWLIAPGQTEVRDAIDRVSFTGRVVCVGYAKTPVEYETRLFVQKEIELRGSRSCVKETDFPAGKRCPERERSPVGDGGVRESRCNDTSVASMIVAVRCVASYQ